MQCTSPRTVSFKGDGRTLAFSEKEWSPEYAPFQIPCNKCLNCRLLYAREWSIRCLHEAKMHKENTFLTLTYKDLKGGETLKDLYPDFQKFMKRLRKQNPNKFINYLVTGEYGDLNKRPHWHALIFGWRPSDQKRFRKSDRGDQIYTSHNLDSLWNLGIAEFGDITIHSANYCSRYATKKLVHGKDKTHSFEPLSRKSTKRAIGKAWLEQHWEDTFNDGCVTLRGGTRVAIPRFYERWLAKVHPDAYDRYIKGIKYEIQREAEKTSRKAEIKEKQNNAERRQRKPYTWRPGVSQNTARATITKAKTEFYNQLKKENTTC